VSENGERTHSSRRNFLKFGAVVATGAVAASALSIPFRPGSAARGAGQKAAATKKPNLGLAEVRGFFNSLQSLQAKTFFLLSITTGLKKGEILSLKLSDLDLGNRMLTPRLSAGTTQKSWVSFYNEEAADYLSKYVDSLPGEAESDKLFPAAAASFRADWKQAQRETGLALRVKSLRKLYQKQMISNGVPVAYLNALRGKALKNAGAGTGVDLSSAKLKEVYDGAKLKILSD
jgi:integrase